MERDLALIRTKRAERERAAGALKAQIPVETLESKLEGDLPGVIDTTLSVPPVNGSEKPAPEDIIMVDQPAKHQYEKNDSIESEAMPNTLKPKKTVSASHEMSRDSNNTKGLAISVDTKPSKNTTTSSSNAGTKQDNNDQMPDQHLETPTTANLRDTDFETMFNDTEIAGGNDGMNLDLGFSTDTNMNQEIMNSNSFQNIAMSSDDLKNFNNTTSSEDINTLLPGLETFVNAGDDFSIGLPTASTQPENTSNVKRAATTSAQQGFETSPVESNFNDLFSSGGFMAGSGDYDMGADGNIDDLGDIDGYEWFKTDVT